MQYVVEIANIPHDKVMRVMHSWQAAIEPYGVWPEVGPVLEGMHKMMSLTVILSATRRSSDDLLGGVASLPSVDQHIRRHIMVDALGDDTPPTARKLWTILAQLGCEIHYDGQVVKPKIGNASDTELPTVNPPPITSPYQMSGRLTGVRGGENSRMRISTPVGIREVRITVDAFQRAFSNVSSRQLRLNLDTSKMHSDAYERTVVDSDSLLELKQMLDGTMIDITERA